MNNHRLLRHAPALVLAAVFSVVQCTNSVQVAAPQGSEPSAPSQTVGAGNNPGTVPPVAPVEPAGDDTTMIRRDQAPRPLPLDSVQRKKKGGGE
jgi:hypothetical protein